MNGRKIRAWLATVLPLLLVVGLAQGSSSAAPVKPDGASPADIAKGQQLRQGGSTYPRLIRLAHSGDANGRVLASMTTFAGGNGFAVIHESTDDGASWHPLSEIHDPAGENNQGMCCSTIYELPQQVGDMPAGTLLWAGTAGIGADEENRATSIRVWRSDDHGRTWHYLSDMVPPSPGPGVWEPEFNVNAAGELVGFYSNDNDPKHDQTIMQVRTSDGVHWRDPALTVANDQQFDVRPGMPGVRRLPNGTFVMTYEVCNLDPKLQCTTNMRTSTDGWHYGDPRNMGIRVVADDGKNPTHTPTISWAPGPGPNGRLILAYQKLVDAQGRVVPGNGTSLMVNDDPTDLTTGWREFPSPVQIMYSRGSTCRGFSPTTLPTMDGKSVIHLATDYETYIPGVCETYFGTGPIAPGTATASTQQAHQPLDTRSGR